MARKNEGDGSTAAEATAAPKANPVSEALLKSVGETAAGITTTAGSASVNDERFKKVTLKDGTVVNRIDYIRARWAQKASRSTIAKELSELTGKKVPYQIVFSATKDLVGGPDQPTAPTAATGAEQPQ